MLSQSTQSDEECVPSYLTVTKTFKPQNGSKLQSNKKVSRFFWDVNLTTFLGVYKILMRSDEKCVLSDVLLINFPNPKRV